MVTLPQTWPVVSATNNTISAALLFSAEGVGAEEATELNKQRRRKGGSTTAKNAPDSSRVTAPS